MFIQQAFDEFLGFEYARIDDKSVEVRLNVVDLHINSAGAIHGGIISSLADVAMSNLLPPDENGTQKMVTVDLKTSFLKPARGAFLIARAKIINEGKRLVHADCQIVDDQEQLVVNSTGIFYKIGTNG
jgi:uncharacterized protein (TIGR00369 family)